MIALDTNILIYAISPEDQQGRTTAALALLDRLGAVRPILPLQVVGEYLNVARRHREIDIVQAVKRIEAIMAVYRCEPSGAEDFLSNRRFYAIERPIFRCRDNSCRPPIRRGDIVKRRHARWVGD